MKLTEFSEFPRRVEMLEGYLVDLRGVILRIQMEMDCEFCNERSPLGHGPWTIANTLGAKLMAREQVASAPA